MAVGAGDGAFLQWDLATLTAIPPLQSFGSFGAASSLAFSPSGDIIAASRPSDEGVRDIILLDVATLEVIATFTSRQKYVHSMTFSPDGKMLAAGGLGDNTVKLWNVATREQIASLEGHDKTIRTGWRFRRKGTYWLQGRTTIRSNCGTWRHGKRLSRGQGIRTWSRRWRFLPMGTHWPLHPGTGP